MGLIVVSAVILIDKDIIEVFRGVYESTTGGSGELYDLIVRAFSKMRDEQRFKDALLVFYPDSSLPNSASTLRDAVVAHFKDSEVIGEHGKHGAVGIKRTHAVTEMIVERFQSALERGTIATWEQLIVDTNIPPIK